MIKFRVYAKLNLSLNVLSKEVEGYHQLEMVNQSISLFDEIRIVPRPDKRISVHCDKNIGVINTALTAANEFAKKFDTDGCDITIKKGIPMQGGLGGSSADAAGILHALAKLHKKPLEEVFAIAELVGSDVKYMMTGGLAKVGGRGEVVNSVASDTLLYFVLVFPPYGLSTRKVFETFDNKPDFNFANNDKLIDCVLKEDIAGIKVNMYNGLQSTAFDIEPRLKELYDELSQHGFAQMTGSGSCLYFVSDNLIDCKFLAEQLQNKGHVAVVAESRTCGVEYLNFNV